MTRWLSGVWDRFVNYDRSTAPPQNTKADKPHTGTHPLGERVTDGNGMLLPQYRTFTGIYNEATKMYSSRFDEAIRAGYENAYAIERDAFVWSLIQERVLPLTRWKWEVTADPNDVQKKTTVPVNPAAPTQNGKDPYSDAREQVRRALEACVSETHDLHQIRFHLGLATYYGRYGTQMRWDRRAIGGYRRVIAGYTQPLHGDKIHYTHDGIPGVMIIATDKSKYQDAGIDVRTFDAFGPAVILSNPAQRNRFIIHKHFLLDANYTDIQAAGKVHGIGYRDFMYWNWWLRDEMIAWVMDFLQKVGNLGLLLFYYEEGNAASQAAAKKAAEESSGQNALTVPFPKGKDPGTAKVELLTANTSGAQLLLDIISQWFERHIERLWVGQSMSSGADNESGLGGTGRADFARDTKHNLLMFDAENQANTFTQDLVRPIKEYNFAEVPWRYKWTYRVPDPSAKEKLDGVQKLMQFLPFVADDVYDLVGVRKPDEGDETVGGPQAQPGQGDTPGGDGMGSPVPGGGPADSPHEGGTPGMGELVAAMMRAAADGDWKTVRELRLLGVDPDGLAGVVDDLEGDEQAPEGQPVDYAGRAGLVDYESDRKKFGSTQVDLDGPVKEKMIDLAGAIDDDDLAEDGKEDEHHVTVKYGLHADRPSEVYRAVGNFGPVSGTLTRLSAFYDRDTGSGYDVLFVDVDSPDLHKLNKRIKTGIDCTDTWPTYKPHATIAYLKPGRAQKYIDQTPPLNVPFVTDRITFSDRDRQPWTILLTGDQRFPVGYESDARLVDYEWVRAQTKTGKVKAVWSGSGERRALYGQRAEQALKAKTGTPGEQVEQPREKARRLKDEREPRRQQAREVYRKAIENPAGVQPHELADLEEHLKTLTRNEIREALRVQGEKTFGKLKDELVQGLLGYVRVDDMPPAPGGREMTPDERDEAGEAMARDDALGKVREEELQAKPQEIQPEDQPYLDRIEDRMQKAAEWSGDRPESMVAEEFGRRAQGELERFQDRYEGKPQQSGQTPVAQESTNRGPLTAGEIATYKMKAREKAEQENKVLASIKRANRKLERLASEQENIKSYFRNATSAGVPVPENFREAYKRNAEEIEKHTQAIEKMKSGMSSTPGDWMSIMADMIVADHPGLYEKHEQYKADGTPFLGFKQKDNPTPPEPTPQQKPPVQPKKERKPRKQRKEPRKLSDYIKSSGGIDPDSHDFKRHFRDMKEAMQNGIPMSVFRRGGRGLDELAESLHREGAVIVPEGVDPSQHVIDELQKKAYSQLEDMTDYWDRKLEEHYRMEEEQRREEEEYARTYGRSEVSRLSEEADRAGQAQALGEFEEDPFGESEIEYREPVEGEEYDDSFDFGFNAVSEQPDEPAKSDLYTGEYQLDIFGNKQPIPKTIKPPVQPSLIPTEIDRKEDVRQAEEILGEWAKRSGNDTPDAREKLPADVVDALKDRQKFSVGSAHFVPNGSAESVAKVLGASVMNVGDEFRDELKRFANENGADWEHVQKVAETPDHPERRLLESASRQVWAKITDKINAMNSDVVLSGVEGLGQYGIGSEDLPKIRGVLMRDERPGNGSVFIVGGVKPPPGSSTIRSSITSQPLERGGNAEDTPTQQPTDQPARGEGDPGRKWAKNDDGTYTAPNGTVWKKAEAGGEISPVTGERFAGGKLMPIHGKSVGMDVEGVGGEGGATVGQGGRREREKKKELKPKQKLTKKARNKDGQLVDIPDDHISLESIVGGGPWHSRKLADESLAYLGIDRETANAIADASDRGIVSVPRNVVGDGRANKAALLAALQPAPTPANDVAKAVGSGGGGNDGGPTPPPSAGGDDERTAKNVSRITKAFPGLSAETAKALGGSIRPGDDTPNDPATYEKAWSDAAIESVRMKYPTPNLAEVAAVSDSQRDFAQKVRQQKLASITSKLAALETQAAQMRLEGRDDSRVTSQQEDLAKWQGILAGVGSAKALLNVKDNDFTNITPITADVIAKKLGVDLAKIKQPQPTAPPQNPPVSYQRWDEADQPRDDIGRFTFKDGDGGGSSSTTSRDTSKATASWEKWEAEVGRIDAEHAQAREAWVNEVDRLDAEHAEAVETWEARSTARDQAKEAIVKLEIPAPSHGLDYPQGDTAEALEVDVARLKEVAASYLTQLQDAVGPESAIERTLIAAGATDKELSRLRAIRDRGASTIARGVERQGKALDALVEQRKKVDAAYAIPEPEQPHPEDYDDQEKFDRDTEKWDAAVEKREAKIDAAQERYQELEDRLNEIQADDIEYEYDQMIAKYDEELASVKEKLTSRIDAAEEADAYPEEPTYPDEPDDPEYPEEPDEDDDED